MAAVTIARTATPTGWWELARRAPATPLRDVIAGFCGYRERSRAVVERTMRPASRPLPQARRSSWSSPTSPYGSREYSALDPEGNAWSFGTYRPTA